VGGQVADLGTLPQRGVGVEVLHVKVVQHLLVFLRYPVVVGEAGWRWEWEITHMGWEGEGRHVLLLAFLVSS